MLCMITGARSDSHVVAGRRGSGTVAIGAVGGQPVEPGDRLVVISYALIADANRFVPRRVAVQQGNHIVDDADQRSSAKLAAI